MRKVSDYDFDLPDELIAQHPAEKRDQSRLLVDAGDGHQDLLFHELVDKLPDDAVLILNDSKVLPSRLHVQKQSGGKVELLGLEQVEHDPKRWLCMAKSSKPVREGAELAVGGELLRVTKGRNEQGLLEITFPRGAIDIFEKYGIYPLPPYIKRPKEGLERDKERYQTVYAKEDGSVAAPTAGLHFTNELLNRLKDKGVTIDTVTLHVGIGTFAPVRCENIDEHTMHEERVTISDRVAELVQSGRPIVAVGSTSLRSLESAAVGRKKIKVGSFSTGIFITPGYEFKVVDQLVTNFHLPKSTLMMMVAAFAGYEEIMKVYKHAVKNRYRFFSYGDAMLLKRKN